MTVSLIALAALAAPRREPQLIVQLKPGADPAAVAARDGVVLRGTTPNAPFALYGVLKGTAASAQARLTADTASIVWAEDNADAQNPESAAVKNGNVKKGSSLSVIGDHNAVVARNTNALAQVDWSAALAASSGRTVRLAILDNGLSRKQTALWAKVDASLDTAGGNADDVQMRIDSNANEAFDEAVGHGTMVTGLAEMIAPQARFVIAKIADSDGSGTAWSIVQGLAFAVNSGAEIANLSMGSPSQVAAFNDVAEWCDSKGLLVVAAIGNSGTQGAWYPARSSKALCVAGLNGDDTKAIFSNWDGTTDSSGPAVGLTSQWWDGSLGTWSGTSFSAPFVSAALADCLRRTAHLKPKDLVKAVTDSGRNVDKLNKNYKGQMGTVLDIQALNRKLVGKP